jgi:hypothetical protein
MSPENEAVFTAFVSRCEETCRHDEGSSEDRSILEYLEEAFGVSSNRYEWGVERPKK